MFISLDQVWKSYAEKSKRNWIYDAFKVHKTDEMKAVLSISSTNLILVPSGFTSKY